MDIDSLSLARRRMANLLGLGEHQVDQLKAAGILDSVTTGCRRPVLGRGGGLRRRHVEMGNRQVLVVEQLVELPGGGHRFGPPKSKAGVRRVTLPGFVCDALPTTSTVGRSRDQTGWCS